MYSKLQIKSDKLTLTSVNWDENIKAVRDLQSVLKTSMGPNGFVKLLVTGGDLLQLTSTSSSLNARMDQQHPICRYIGHMVQNLPDFGLYFGIMISHLIEELWIDNSFLKLKLTSCVQTLLGFVKKKLTSDLVCKKVDFSSINDFLPLVRTVISSKCSTLNVNFDTDRFCIEIVKAFLNSVDEQTNSVGRVIVKVETGSSSVSCHNGLLYKITEDHDLNFIQNIKGEVKVLIFTVKLDNSDVKDCISVVDPAMFILQKAVGLNVRLIACQKTVSSDIKLYLMRQKVILMDRMGTDLTNNLIHLSQAFPISDTCLAHNSDISKLTGRLTSIQHIQFNESSYVLLESPGYLISTLLIQNYSLAGTDHLETLTQQALSSLRCLALHPSLTFGGGCLETWLISQISELKESHIDKEFFKVCHWFQHSLLSACGPTMPDLIDTMYHHGWANESLRCKCGVVSADELTKAKALLVPIEELINQSVTFKSPQQTVDVLSDTIVDCYQQKLNAIVYVLETFANIADIGFIMYKD